MIIKDALSYLSDPALKKITDKLIGTATSLGSRQSMQLAITWYFGQNSLTNDIQHDNAPGETLRKNPSKTEQLLSAIENL